MISPIGKVLGEGNCVRVTERGEEACECVDKPTSVFVVGRILTKAARLRTETSYKAGSVRRARRRHSVFGTHSSTIPTAERKQRAGTDRHGVDQAASLESLLRVFNGSDCRSMQLAASVEQRPCEPWSPWPRRDHPGRVSRLAATSVANDHRTASRWYVPTFAGTTCRNRQARRRHATARYSGRAGSCDSTSHRASSYTVVRSDVLGLEPRFSTETFCSRSSQASATYDSPKPLLRCGYGSFEILRSRYLDGPSLE